MSKSFMDRVKEVNSKPNDLNAISKEKVKEFKTISIVNNKGGVGKTTIAFNFACILAYMGKKVLVLDNDPQANASRLLQIDQNTDCLNMSKLYLDNLKADSIIEKSRFQNVWIIPTSISQEDTEESIVKRKDNLKILNKWISDNQKALSTKYELDYIIIDCSPSMGVLNKNAYLASDSLIIIMGPDLDAINGLINFDRAYDPIYKRESKKATTNVKAVVLNKMDEKSPITGIFLEQLKARKYPYKSLVLDEIISYADAVGLTKALAKPINLLSDDNNEFFKVSYEEMKRIIDKLQTKEVL